MVIVFLMELARLQNVYSKLVTWYLLRKLDRRGAPAWPPLLDLRKAQFDLCCKGDHRGSPLRALFSCAALESYGSGILRPESWQLRPES